MSRGLVYPRDRFGAATARTPDTRFGAWFQRSDIWKRYVVEQALADFERLLDGPGRRFDAVLDAGCGAGQAFDGIARRFGAQRITAIDVDPAMLAPARANAAHCDCAVDVRSGDLERLPCADASFDLVVCHQTLHHVEDQAAVLRGFLRVLKPGGTLLLAESCRAFTLSLRVRLLFRHRSDTQQSPQQFLALTRAAGFRVDDADVALPRPFWSQPDFGMAEWLGWKRSARREPAEVQVVATRPRTSRAE